MVDLESVVSIKQIRQHAKLDDHPGQDDSLLTLYRASAFEAAEHYTGRSFTGLRTVTQAVAQDITRTSWKPTLRVRLHHPTYDGVITVTGLPQMMHATGSQIINVEPGSTRIEIPAFNLDPMCCVNTGKPPESNYGVSIVYRHGISCAEDVPAGIILGVLKYIAWSIMNAGDELMIAQQPILTHQATSNNAAIQSGAVEQWRQYRRDA